MKLFVFLFLTLIFLINVVNRSVKAIHISTNTRPQSKRIVNDDFIPLPPPIHCDSLFTSDDGIQCVYIVDKSSRITTDLKRVNVTMDGNEWDTYPPDTINKLDGGWLSFHSKYFASNQTCENWNGLVQYAGMDDKGTTYIMQLALDSSGGIIDYSFEFPQVMFDATPQQTSDLSATGFELYDRRD